jgi:hypothetical protein
MRLCCQLTPQHMKKHITTDLLQTANCEYTNVLGDYKLKSFHPKTVDVVEE